MRISFFILFLLFSAPAMAQEASLESSSDTAFRIEPGSQADGERVYSGRVGQDTLVRALRVKAKDGKNRDAQYDLCMFYAEQQDFKESFKWCAIAADNGDVEAQVKMGDIYTQGLGVEVNKKEAFNWYLYAADNGSEAAQLIVAAAYNNGDGVPQSNADAWYWLTITAGENEDEASRAHRAELAASLDPFIRETLEKRVVSYRQKHPKK